MTHLFDHTVALLVPGEATAGRLALLETVEVPGREPPCHRHHWEDELIYVLQGKLAVQLAGAWQAAPADTLVLIPRGAEHTFAVLSETARLLTVFAPAGFEGFYRELNSVPAKNHQDAHEVERRVAMAARYGCEITGPHPGRPAPDRFPAAGSPAR